MLAPAETTIEVEYLVALDPLQVAHDSAVGSVAVVVVEILGVAVHQIQHPPLPGALTKIEAHEAQRSVNAV